MLAKFIEKVSRSYKIIWKNRRLSYTHRSSFSLAAGGHTDSLKLLQEPSAALYRKGNQCQNQQFRFAPSPVFGLLHLKHVEPRMHGGRCQVALLGFIFRVAGSALGIFGCGAEPQYLSVTLGICRGPFSICFLLLSVGIFFLRLHSSVPTQSRGPGKLQLTFPRRSTLSLQFRAWTSDFSNLFQLFSNVVISIIFDKIPVSWKMLIPSPTVITLVMSISIIISMIPPVLCLFVAFVPVIFGIIGEAVRAGGAILTKILWFLRRE